MPSRGGPVPIADAVLLHRSTVVLDLGLVEVSMTVTESPDSTKTRLVVVGNGMAGIRVIEEVLVRGGADAYDITATGDDASKACL